jgi:uncharacterized membrane protein SirB2
MNLSELSTLHVLHVSAALVLVGYTFYALAAPPEARKRVMIWTGSAAIVMLLTGVRMWQELYGFAPARWLVVKIVCWLGLAGLSGVAFRKRQAAGLFSWLAILFAVTAVAMAYLKPF